MFYYYFGSIAGDDIGNLYYCHEKKMTRYEVLKLLNDTWKNVTKHQLIEEGSDVYSQDLLLTSLLKDAGFVGIKWERFIIMKFFRPDKDGKQQFENYLNRLCAQTIGEKTIT